MEKIEVKIYFRNKEGKLVFFVFYIEPTKEPIKAVKALVDSVQSEFGYEFHSVIYDSE